MYMHELPASANFATSVLANKTYAACMCMMSLSSWGQRKWSMDEMPASGPSWRGHHWTCYFILVKCSAYLHERPSPIVGSVLLRAYINWPLENRGNSVALQTRLHLAAAICLWKPRAMSWIRKLLGNVWRLVHETSVSAIHGTCIYSYGGFRHSVCMSDANCHTKHKHPNTCSI